MDLLLLHLAHAAVGGLELHLFEVLHLPHLLVINYLAYQLLLLAHVLERLLLLLFA